MIVKSALRLRSLSTISLLFCLSILLPKAPFAADDDFWEANYCGPGIADSCVNASVVFESMLVVGGNFASVDGISGTRLIAAWDGVSWHDIGGGLDGDEYAQVSALFVWQGKLIAGGDFSSAGGSPAQSIAQWDGSSWQPLGTGIDLLVMAFAEYNGNLVAGGVFSSAGEVGVANIAQWNGSSWSGLGSGITTEVFFAVRALQAYNGRLFAGGDFTTAGGSPAANIAAWNGTTWAAVAGGTDAPVYGMTEYGGELIAVGAFGVAGGSNIPYVASWDDSQWSAVGSPGTQFIDSVCCATIFDGDLYIGGAFVRFGGSDAGDVARWDGTAWHAVGSRLILGSAYTLAAYDTMLVAAGDFKKVYGPFASPPMDFTVNQIAQFAGDDWLPVGMGLDDVVWELKEYGGQLVAGGDFLEVANLVATLGESCWSRFGQPNEITTVYSGGVYALQEYGGSLYAGGRFDLPESGPAILAVWNGNQWGARAGGAGYIEDMIVWNGNLVVGGSFSSVQGSTANIVAYDGSTWSSLGSGLNSGVSDMVVYGSDLVVGGNFTQAGGDPANGIARWNGTDWSTFGSGLSGVRSVCVYNVQLYAATSTGLYRWEDPDWSLIEDMSLTGSIAALEAYDNLLIVAGDFDVIGGVPARSIASFNGSTWEALGSGVETTGGGSVWALYSYNGKLYVGGNFVTAGSKPSHYVAAWTKTGPCCEGIRGNIDGSGDGEINISDVTYMVAYMFKKGTPPPCYAEANVDGLGDIDIADLTFLVSYMFKSGSEPPACP